MIILSICLKKNPLILFNIHSSISKKFLKPCLNSELTFFYCPDLVRYFNKIIFYLVKSINIFIIINQIVTHLNYYILLYVLFHHKHDPL